jgi:hypothetical protein
MPSAKAADAVFARVQTDGTFQVQDEHGRAILRNKRIRRGERVKLTVRRLRDERSYRQWKAAHALGALIAQNIDEFAQFQLDDGRIDAHGALKHLQALSGVECEETLVTLDNGDQVLCRFPRSLAFDEMDEPRFQSAYAGFCAYLRKRWWHELEDWQIESMANLVGEAA